jgi:RNA polymerase sigma-70 factor (ECF subfamily)
MVRTAWRLEKRKRRRAELSFEGILDQEDDKTRGEQIQEDERDKGPLAAVLKAEVSSEIQSALQCLDLKYRTVVLLYYYNELSTKEIAKVTGTMEGTVKSRLFKARKLLKDLLKEESSADKEEERGVCHG